MLATAGIGEWGFAALIEVDGRSILFDTGNHPDTVLRNAGELEVDLGAVRDVVVSHFHGDHTGGLLALRRALAGQEPAALSRLHVAKGIFYQRKGASGTETNGMIAARTEYESTGGRVVEHDSPVEIYPRVWLTGPVPRVHPERNWSGSGQVRTPDGWQEDTIPESQSLVVETEEGLVVVSGCGHAGIINTLEHLRRNISDRPVLAAIGGFHLLATDDRHLEWTGRKLREFGLQHFLGAHCTGIEAVYQIREAAGLSRRTCVVGAVGASFTPHDGIDPLWLAR